MNGRFYFLASVAQLVFGLAGVAAYTLLTIAGQNVAGYLWAAGLSVVLVILGITGIRAYQKRQ